MIERTPAERDHDRAARQIARQVRNSRDTARVPAWRWALAAGLFLASMALSVTGGLGELSAAATLIGILVAGALVA